MVVNDRGLKHFVQAILNHVLISGVHLPYFLHALGGKLRGKKDAGKFHVELRRRAGVGIDLQLAHGVVQKQRADVIHVLGGNLQGDGSTLFQHLDEGSDQPAARRAMGNHVHRQVDLPLANALLDAAERRGCRGQRASGNQASAGQLERSANRSGRAILFGFSAG